MVTWGRLERLQLLHVGMNFGWLILCCQGLLHQDELMSVFQSLRLFVKACWFICLWATLLISSCSKHWQQALLVVLVQFPCDTRGIMFLMTIILLCSGLGAHDLLTPPKPEQTLQYTTLVYNTWTLRCPWLAACLTALKWLFSLGCSYGENQQQFDDWFHYWMEMSGSNCIVTSYFHKHLRGGVLGVWDYYHYSLVLRLRARFTVFAA